MFFILTLAIWLGFYALRTYVPSAVWNMADELPLSYKPMFAVGAHIIGMLGFIVVRFLRRRALDTLVITFGIVTVARQVFIANDSIGPWLSLLSWVLWLWLMISLADEIAAQDAERLIAPALAAAVALQVGMQAAWHGLDLQSVRGPIAVAASAALAIALCFAVLRMPREPLRRPDAAFAWVLLGVALFLEVTLAANAGRFAQISGLEFPLAVFAIQLGALIAIYVATRATTFWIRVAFIIAGFIAVFAVTRFSGNIALMLIAVQVIIICGVREAADIRLRWSGSTAFTIGGLIYFALIFAFYNAYELTPLWIVSFAALSVAAALAQRSGDAPVRATVLAFAPAFVLTMLYFVPPGDTPEPPQAELRVLSYNIHHGFDDDGVPGMQRTVDEIVKLNPDVIGFQEIGRGWTLLGGNDLIAYLRWRMPGYIVHFEPTNGQLWGNAVMSRRPVLFADGEVFDAEPGDFRYGYTTAAIELAADTILFMSVHLTADLAGPSGDARLTQAQSVVDHAMTTVLRRKERVIIAGDFNAHPDEAPIKHLTGALSDLGARVGLSNQATWPAGNPVERIDYVFGAGIEPVAGKIPRITASDHLPVLITIRGPNATRSFAASSNRQSSTESPVQ